MFLLIGILYVGAISTGTTCGAASLNWFQAQQKCSQDGKMLTNNKSSIPLQGHSDYWFGQYKDLSRWIHILGCYNASDVLAEMGEEINMEIPSPGLCQANCILKGRDIFGIQNNTCLCLKRRIVGSKQPPSQCSFTCNSDQDKIFSTECGGPSSYNVFLTGQLMADQQTDSKCIALQCRNDPTFLIEDCSGAYSRVCQSQVNGTFYQRDWQESMDLCVTNTQSYLIADVDDSNITAACISLGNNSYPIPWIGIAMQWFMNFDQGKIISGENYGMIKRCKKCNKQRCEMIDCYTPLETEVKCISIPSTTTKPTTSSSTKRPETTTFTTSTTTTKPTISSSTTTTKPTTSSSITQSETTVFTTSSATSIVTNATMHENVSGKSDEQGSNEHVVLIGILVTVAVLIVVGVVIGILILKRRQVKIPKNVTQEGMKKRLPETQHNKNYNESNNSMNNNYFVLEPSKSDYEVPDDSEQKPESPYDDGEEGTYDHLRDKESRRKTADNVYQHAHYLQTDDSSDYDFAGGAQNQEIENPYYDHANGHTRNSDYGYNTLDRS